MNDNKLVSKIIVFLMLFMILGIAKVSCMQHDYGESSDSFLSEQQVLPSLTLIMENISRLMNHDVSKTLKVDTIIDMLKGVCCIYFFQGKELKESILYQKLIRIYPKYATEDGIFYDTAEGPDTSNNVGRIMSVWNTLDKSQRNLNERLSLCFLVSHFCIFIDDWTTDGEYYIIGLIRDLTSIKKA